MKKTQDIISGFFIICISILTIVSILGIWDFLIKDVLTKSFQTIGLLAFVAVIVGISARFMEPSNQPEVEAEIPQVNPIFPAIRRFTVMVLISSASLLALLGILAIWEVLAGQVVSKSISSISILAFSSFIIIVTCYVREKREIFHRKVSGWSVFFLLILFFWILSIAGNM